MKATPLDAVWVGCIIIVNVLYFIRKGILARHGIMTGLLDLELKDWSRLRELAEKQPSATRRMVYLGVNAGFALFFALAVAMLIVSRSLRR